MKPQEVTSHARKGAAWSLIIAGVALPLSYLRDVLLGRAGDGSGELLGAFALLLVFVNAVYTFLFPGGRNVFPTYFPKIASEEDRSRFVSGFFYLVLAGAIIGLVTTFVWPGAIDFVLQQPVDGQTRTVLRCIIPLALFSTLANSVVMGNMSFVWASLMLRVQIVCVTAVAAALCLMDARATLSDGMLWLSGAVALGATINMGVCSVILFRSVRLRLRPMFPAGCLRFTSITYLDTVMMFAYLAMDRYFVSICFSLSELGIYFAMYQIARVIPLAVQQLGHLLLTTFSKLLGTDAEDALVSSYRRVSRLTIGFYAAVSLAIIFFSKSIAGIFGPTFAEHHGYLIALAMVMNLDSLRTINGMTLMAYERMDRVLLSKIFQNVAQFVTTFALIGPFGIYGVIVGKGVGHVVSALVLVVGTARLRQTTKLLPPSAYLVGQVVVGLAAWAAYAWSDRGLPVSALGVLVGWFAVWIVGGFRIDDIRAMIPWRRGRVGVGS